MDISKVAHFYVPQCISIDHTYHHKHSLQCVIYMSVKRTNCRWRKQLHDQLIEKLIKVRLTIFYRVKSSIKIITYGKDLCINAVINKCYTRTCNWKHTNVALQIKIAQTKQHKKNQQSLLLMWPFHSFVHFQRK